MGVRTSSRRGLFKAIVHILSLGALALVSVELVFESGSRGFLAFDQSILFDGGYRIFLGQIPYRDFFIPTGPVPFWIQGFFFQLFSVNYSAYLLHAAMANLLAVLSAYLWVRCIYPESFGYALLAASVTAFWFYPPLGTPWFEQTAFLFHFLASLLLFYGFGLAERKRVWTAVLVGASGWMTGLAFLSKQNAGLLSVAACIAVIVVAAPGGVRTRVRFLGSFLTGLAAVGLVFGAWLWRFSHPENFWTYFFVIPHEEGMRRIAGGTIHRLFLEEFSAAGANRAVVLACFLAAATALVIHARFRLVKRSGLGEPGILAATTVVSLYLFQALFHQVTLNEPEVGFPFGGVILALGALLVRDLVETGSGVGVAEESSKDSVRRALLPVLAISAALLLIPTRMGGIAVAGRARHLLAFRVSGGRRFEGARPGKVGHSHAGGAPIARGDLGRRRRRARGLPSERGRQLLHLPGLHRHVRALGQGAPPTSRLVPSGAHL